MSVTPEGFGAIPADVGVPSEAVAEPEAIQSESLPDTEVQAEAPETETPAAVEPETPVKGPIPYDRFEQVNRRKNELEAEISTLGQLKQLYALAETDPLTAAEGFRMLSESLARGNQDDAELDSMTDTERRLYGKLQALEQTVAETRQGAQSAQDSIAERELRDAMSVLKREADEKGLPFDPDAVSDAMDNLNLEKLVKSGKSVEDMARLAYKAVAFDALPEAVRKQTYAAQQKKAGAQLAPATSKGGQTTARVGTVAEAVNEAYRKLGLPDN